MKKDKKDLDKEVQQPKEGGKTSIKDSISNVAKGIVEVMPSGNKIKNTASKVKDEIKTSLKKEQIETPDHYKQLKQKSLKGMHLPKDAKAYGMRTKNASFIFVSFAVSEQESMPFDNDQMIIDQLHDSLGENQGIIEVRSGKTASGKPFVFDILKMSSVSKEGFPMGMSYILNINAKMDKSIQFINGSFSEEGMTGMRDSVCFAMFRQSNSSESEDLLDGWFRDPYDSNYTKGLRMNFSEQEGLDEKFPWHPLSELRRLVKYIIENN